MPYSITVAIPTFRRPAGIVAALESVLPQAEALGSGGEVSVRVLVIDNDPDASAREPVASFAVDYVHEPRPGIAAVRNRALGESMDSDALVFLDDDEIATDGWLATLVARHRETGADAVAGRVQTDFPPGTDPWVRASGAFRRPERADGQSMDEAATNNLLLDLATVRRLGLRFDEAFGLTGGSDSLFTRQLVARGGTIRWAQDALVVELEDQERFNRAWILMRVFRFGNTSTRVDIALAQDATERLLVRVERFFRGLVRVAGGGARSCWGVLSGSLSHRARGLRTVYRGAGMIAGSGGFAFSEYGARRKRMGIRA
ncbi:glycosyltransferase [Mycetocola sp. 2940]|uniref:glycosyltransferase family 2 protein n=1 Tax=Mycetocola sp. 2940 TaxID=3156452 RepID=UPI003395D38C